MNLAVVKNKKGFGLLEVLVSAVIVIMILSSLVMIGRRALANNTYYEQRAQAIFLAQEQLEGIRNMRDSNWIDGNDKTEWSDFVVYSYDTNGIKDKTPPKEMMDDNNTTQYYYYWKVGFGTPDVFYHPSLLAAGMGEILTLHDGGTKFTRKLQFIKSDESGKELGDILLPNNDGIHKEINAIKVISIVEWDFDGQKKSVSVSEILTNWRPNF